MNGKIQSVTELIPEKHFTSRRSRMETDEVEKQHQQEEAGSPNKRSTREEAEEAKVRFALLQ